jgi:hypothetical protein
MGSGQCSGSVYFRRHWRSPGPTLSRHAGATLSISVWLVNRGESLGRRCRPGESGPWRGQAGGSSER